MDQILSIAPILPGQQTSTKQSQPVSTQPTKTSNASLQPPAPAQSQAHKPSVNLIDLDSRPTSTAPPENTSNSIQGNPLHPTSNPKQVTPVHQSTAIAAPAGNQVPTGNLLDDDHQLNDKMSNMTMQQPLQPKPIQRTDTDTNEPEEFVDAQG